MIGENGEERISLSERFPIALKSLEIHHEFPHSPVTERRAGAPLR